MDGVDNVNFRDLDIYDLKEQSPLGSELCGEYWDEDSRFFNGGGHFLTNTPYFYGYTGNRVHGIFTDWADFSFSGDINIYDLTSETGFVRGVGMYTESTLTVSQETKIKISELEAGSTLYDHDTSQFGHPYAPAMAKPFHILGVWDQNGFEFSSEINGDVNPANIQFSCIFGRDGILDADWKFKIDNSKCQSDAAIRAVSLQNTASNSHSASGSIHLNHWLILLTALVAILVFVQKCHRQKKQVSESTESLPLLNSN